MLYATDKRYHPFVKLMASYRLKLFSKCKDEDLSPKTSLTYLVSIMSSKDTDNYQAKELFQHYLQIGCDVNATDEAGYGPLHSAILFREPDIIMYLRRHGAKPNVQISEPSLSLGRPKNIGMNAYTFSDFLCAKDKLKCEEIRNALYNEI